MNNNPIIEIDTHGMRVEEALKAVDRAVQSAGTAVYKIKVIHGFNRGTAIRQAIVEEYRYGYDKKVKRVTPGENQGITELILKELY